MQRPSPVMLALSEYVSEAAKRSLPEAVTEKVKHHIVDTVAAMVSGSRLLPGASAIAYIRTQGGAKQSSVIGSGIKTTAVNAALANGMLAHADETDDSHPESITHPGCAVVPAALAVGEWKGRSGAEFIRAVALGYDLASRTTMALGVQHVRGSHRSTHAIGGVFGAAAAAASLTGLSAQRVRYVLSFTAQQASGLHCWVRDPDHIEKAFDFGGMPARNAVAAVTMVEAGMTGVDDVFSGDRSFFSAFSKAGNPELLTKGLGEDFAIMSTNIKKWCVGSPIQSVLDATESLLKTHGLQGSAIDKIEVSIPTEQVWVVDNRDMPNISLQHLVAVLLTDGQLTFASCHDEARMTDANVLRLKGKVVIKGSDALSAARPRLQAIVEIVTSEKRHLSHHAKVVRGTAADPMSRREVEQKSLDLIYPVLGKDKAERLLDALWTLEQCPDLRLLNSLMQPSKSRS